MKVRIQGNKIHRDDIHLLEMAIAKLSPRSEELSLFCAIVDSGERTEEFYMSKHADDEWEHAQKEQGATDREDWAKEESYFQMELGYPSHFFSGLEMMNAGSWLIHFTDSDPDDITSSGFHGRSVDIIGLTNAWKDGTNEGPLALAYDATYNIPNGSAGYGKYGRNAVIFQVKEAVSAHHCGDEETQVVFDVSEAYNLWPIWENDGFLVLHDPKTGESVLAVERNDFGVEQIISFVKANKPGKTKAIPESD